MSGTEDSAFKAEAEKALQITKFINFLQSEMATTVKSAYAAKPDAIWVVFRQDTVSGDLLCVSTHTSPPSKIRSYPGETVVKYVRE